MEEGATNVHRNEQRGKQKRKRKRKHHNSKIQKGATKYEYRIAKDSPVNQ